MFLHQQWPVLKQSPVLYVLPAAVAYIEYSSSSSGLCEMFLQLQWPVLKVHPLAVACVKSFFFPSTVACVECSSSSSGMYWCISSSTGRLLSSGLWYMFLYHQWPVLGVPPAALSSVKGPSSHSGPCWILFQQQWPVENVPPSAVACNICSFSSNGLC